MFGKAGAPRVGAASALRALASRAAALEQVSRQSELTQLAREQSAAVEAMFNAGAADKLELSSAQVEASASDLAFALESQTGGTTSVRSKPDASTPPRRFLLKLGLVSIILLVLGVAIGSRLAWRAPEAFATTYKQQTFRRGTIYHSRFASGGQSVYYSAKWGQEPLTVFAAQEGRRAETSLGLTNADLLAVSRAGDLAVLTDIRHLGWFANEGTLAPEAGRSTAATAGKCDRGGLVSGRDESGGGPRRWWHVAVGGIPQS